MSAGRVERLIAMGICPAESASQLVRQLQDLSDKLSLRELKSETRIFKALSDPRRLKIIKLLSHRKMCVCELDLAMDITQPAISHHLSILENAGLVQTERKGKWIFYSVSSRARHMLREAARIK